MVTKTLTLKVNEIQANPNNPRVIKDHKFKQLVKSIEEFPEMLSIREIVVDETNMILGGNMRWKACVHAGLKNINVTQVTGLTDMQKKEFIIKDNANYGVWDWDQLANNFDSDVLSEWGLNVWQPTQFLNDEHEETGTSAAPIDPEAEQAAEDEKAEKNIIQIEFNIEDYDEALALFKKRRGEAFDIAGAIINKLKQALCK
jgi:hypothetical protein